MRPRPKDAAPTPHPEKQPFCCRRPKTNLVKFLHSSGVDGGPSTPRLHFGRRQPGGGQCQTHSVLRRALPTAQVTSGTGIPGGGGAQPRGKRRRLEGTRRWARCLHVVEGVPADRDGGLPNRTQPRCLRARSELQRSRRKQHGMAGHLELSPTGPQGWGAMAAWAPGPAGEGSTSEEVRTLRGLGRGAGRRGYSTERSSP